MVRARVRIDPRSLDRILGDYCERRLGEIAEEFVDTARGFSSRRTGALADSIEAEDVRRQRDRVTCRVFVGEEYGIYQDQGTGIYGPTGERITAASGGVLVFDWPSAGGTVFARSVAGSEPTRFWTRTVERWDAIVRAAA